MDQEMIEQNETGPKRKQWNKKNELYPIPAWLEPYVPAIEELVRQHKPEINEKAKALLQKANPTKSPDTIEQAVSKVRTNYDLRISKTQQEKEQLNRLQLEKDERRDARRQLGLSDEQIDKLERDEGEPSE